MGEKLREATRTANSAVLTKTRKMTTITITKDTLDLIQSDAGGYTRAALELIGEKFPPKVKGWKHRALGREIDKEAYDTFVREGLRNPKKKAKSQKSTKSKKYKEYSHNGMFYMAGCLEGDWWICRLWKRPNVPTVQMEYEWGKTKKEVLAKKNLPRNVQPQG